MNNKTAWTLVTVLSTLASTQLGCGDDGKDSAPKTITLKPFAATGQALTAPDKTWTYVEFPDTTCRDGSPAGIAVSLNSQSKKLMIYLEGGGACFDSTTCLLSPADASIFKAEKTTGVFNRTEPTNPVADWNVVYVPYCTGDTHGGAKKNATVDGVSGVHQFTGYSNITSFLQRIVPTFPGVTDVLLTGISAGGFGAAQNAIQVAEAFPNVNMHLIDDSGPGFSTKVMPSCLQAKWRDTFGFEDTFLKDCGDACPDHDDFVQDYAIAVTQTFVGQSAGLIESIQDGTISKFLAAGNNECTGRALLDQVPLDAFSLDLLDYRTKVAKLPNFGTYFPDGSQHTWIGADTMFTANTGGVKLIDWFTKIINNQPPGNAGP